MEKKKEEVYIEEFVKALTLEDKIGMIHGAGLFRTAPVKRLGIPALYMSDGPMGVRAEFADNEWRNTGNSDDYVSYLPCNSAIASTWNTKLAYEMGKVLGEEARGRGKDVILAPGINIKRSPLCGRNFEYMSEDPRLIEKLAPEIVKGIQENDVACCVKHFAVNSQESNRLIVDTIVDEKTLMDIYFPGFKACVDAGAYSIMGAYNLLNGEHCSTSKYLLCHVLREKWNYDGTVISDWGAVHDSRDAAMSSLDIEMDVHYNFDQHFMAEPLKKLVEEGQIDEHLINDKVRNILRMMYRLKMIGDRKYERKSGAYNTAEHHEKILDTGRESIILLKNEESLLPLREYRDIRVAVIGENAVTKHSNGGGSAEVKALYEITPLMGIKKLLGGNARVTYAPGYASGKEESLAEVNWQADSTKLEAEKRKNETEEVCAESLEVKRKRYKEEALALAGESDLVIFVGGQNHDQDSEGMDRESMKLPYNQDELINELLEVCPNMVVTIMAGSPIEMPWKDKAKAILFSYYNGMEGGTALAEVLFGRINPSGKLAETFPIVADDCPAHSIGTFGELMQVNYLEKEAVGYRYYNDGMKKVNFCFGHGLSYSHFAYKLVSCEGNLRNAEDKLEIKLQIENVSTLEGKEVIQVYQKAKRLLTFEKVKLLPGEKKTVVLSIGQEDLLEYDVEKAEYCFYPGEYCLQIGSSSRDCKVEVNRFLGTEKEA